MRYFQFVKNSLEVLLMILCIVGISILGAQYVLNNHFGDLVVHLTSLSNEQNQKTHEINQVNFLTKQTQTIQNEYTIWTPLITKIANIIPEGVVLSNMTYSVTANRITLSGERDGRENLLKLKENLESLENIKSVDIPISQLTEKTKAQFSISVPILEE